MGPNFPTEMRELSSMTSIPSYFSPSLVTSLGARTHEPTSVLSRRSLGVVSKNNNTMVVVWVQVRNRHKVSVPVSGFALLSKNPKRAMPSVIVTARLRRRGFCFLSFSFSLSRWNTYEFEIASSVLDLSAVHLPASWVCFAQIVWMGPICPVDDVVVPAIVSASFYKSQIWMRCSMV